MAKVKLIWDFRGPAAKRTAEHHCIHLNEFIALESIESESITTEEFSEMHVCALLIINEDDVPFMREKLKPHRGQLVK
ncbi:hypothetical protein H2O64_21960 [Kordia sp. YSTF-M3]|uniref:Uncharacterized protein n=1 Tax=Kordia aestuariivivens TaxID=2759037 RepID=A0ABR7QFJ7_9FLAO|nr:hypothetical protein [Kordia aestuariivivens]MBC8757350.1 hypothetical protein [Kordia aestuariivivens]